MTKKEIHETEQALQSIWSVAGVPEKVLMAGKSKKGAKIKLKNLMDKLNRNGKKYKNHFHPLRSQLPRSGADDRPADVGL